MRPTADRRTLRPARMKLAMYRGPATGLGQKLLHWIICLFTWSQYSHVELVIDGMCYSASSRDDGVRCKDIDLESGRWDVFELPHDIQRRSRMALAWFVGHDGESYDWIGVARMLIVLRWLPVRERHHFCSKAIASALGLPHPEEFSPEGLLDYLVDPL